MIDLFIKPTDTHQFLDLGSSHCYHYKKRIPYSQVLRLNRICSCNESFDKRSNDLERWLMGTRYNGTMTKKKNIKSPRTFQERSPLKIKKRNFRGETNV